MINTLKSRVSKAVIPWNQRVRQWAWKPLASNLEQALSERQDKRLLWGVCFLLLLLIGWATVAPIDKIVRAPTAGFVNRLYFNTLGGVIKAGEAVLEITPSEGPLAVEARVRPDDRASLRTGLPTRVMVGAYDYTVYGALEGKVVEVSSDTLPDEHGQRYYRVLVQTLPANGALSKEIILPGMTASADVVVGQRSVLSYLLSPLLRFSARALSEPQ